LMSAADVHALRHSSFRGNEGVAGKTLKDIVRSKASKGKDSFAVEGYPPKTTHAYWFVDGAAGMDVKLSKTTWMKIADWAADEFHRQLIYVSSGNDALMDPPSLAMAACLINRIRRLSVLRSELAAVSRKLPTTVELEFGIEQVFSQQSESGIWHRYFPLFHFPTGGGAADYCFSFEFLEAILMEFGSSVLRRSHLLERIERVLRWCDTHELEFTDSSGTYRGWNSGGEVRNLAAGKSESWATATVHMFLSQLDRKVSDLLDELVLKRFGIDRTAVVQSGKKLNGFIDAKIRFSGERPTSLKTVIKQELLKVAKNLDSEKLITEGLPVPRSALLFGPPGVSKTRLASSIAEDLGWPLVVITPSEFLGKGLEQVHAQVDERFRDLMDLRKVVVFFDEMDALAHTREGDDQPAKREANEEDNQSDAHAVRELDVTRQLLTTSMLPKLANLWDQKRVIFLLATNHKQQLDPAITRPNRFDLLLCVSPPSWVNKSSLRNLGLLVPPTQTKEVEKELRRLVPRGSAAAKCLDYFTVAEVGIFLNHLSRLKGVTVVSSALKQFEDTSEFDSLVCDWARNSITLRTGGRAATEFAQDLKESRRQYYPTQK
jgi:hypothetical protein